jgi:hypothetical protein
LSWNAEAWLGWVGTTPVAVGVIVAFLVTDRLRPVFRAPSVD